MKFGFRTPSLSKRIAARTSAKRVIAHKVGLKAPRGLGALTNPKKAAYNAIYSRTTMDPLKGYGRRRAKGAADVSTSEDFFNLLGLLFGAIWFMCALPFKLIRVIKTWHEKRGVTNNETPTEAVEAMHEKPARWSKREWQEFSVGLGFILVVGAILLDVLA